MKFYNACIQVAEAVETMLNKEEQALFMETEDTQMYLYHFSLGIWIRDHYLKPDDYLYQAFCCLGLRDRDRMSSYLLLFIKSHWLLKRADML